MSLLSALIDADWGPEPLAVDCLLLSCQQTGNHVTDRGSNNLSDAER